MANPNSEWDINVFCPAANATVNFKIKSNSTADDLKKMVVANKIGSSGGKLFLCTNSGEFSGTMVVNRFLTNGSTINWVATSK